MSTGNRIGVLWGIVVLVGIGLTACQRSTQLTGDEGGNGTSLIVSAGEETYFFSCLQTKGASRADECRVGSAAAEAGGHRTGTSNYFVWAIAAIFANDRDLILPLLCGQASYDRCLGWLGVQKPEVERYRGSRCRYQSMFSFEGPSWGSECGGWRQPRPRPEPTPVYPPQVQFTGYKKNGKSMVCKPKPENFACTAIYSPDEEAWKQRCTAAGFTISPCGCTNLCSARIL